MSTNGSSKTQRQKKWSPTIVLSLSLTWESFSSLTHAPQWVSVCCVINGEAHSLFILFHSLNFHPNKSPSLKNYLRGPTSLGESNNPSASQLWGLCPPINKRVNLNSIVGTIAPNYNEGLTSMNLHDFIILMTLSVKGINISIKVQLNTIRNIQVNMFRSYKYINTPS